jgi:hypothetical protein
MEYTVITAFLSMLLTISFAQKKYKDFNEESIPSDLKAKGHILLVHTPFLESDEKKNAEIKEAFEKNYTGKFVVVPSASKDWDNKVYDDKKIYKYSISILETSESHMIDNDPKKTIVHKKYELSIVDRSKITKENFDAHAVKDSIMRSNGGKKPSLDELKKAMKDGDIDRSAIHKTGLVDDQDKLADMLIYLAKKLEVL